jgi:dipeptidyl aminopeptidase/acylaminoacyl peptidase
VATTVAMLMVAVSPLATATVDGRNGRVAFRGYLNNAHTHGAIFTINPDGSGLRQVTHPGPGKISSEPDWSPNGRWIAYHLGDSDGPTRVFKIRPDGSDRTRVSRCSGACLADGYPAWAPHGRRIAVEREACSTGRNNLLTIYIMRADGTHARRVTQRAASCATSHRFEDHAPQWEPNATRLAFERVDHQREKHAVFTVRLDGTGLRRLSPWRMDAAQPDWSPNGRWIVFRTQEQSDTRGNLVLVHPDGTGLHVITHGGNTYKWLSCSFSPNGRQITAARAPGDGATDNADVYTMKLDGSGRTNITNSTDAWESAPDWGPRH